MITNKNIKEQKDYYPFGKEHENPNLITSTNRWGFSGKEKQTVKNLGFLDFGARMLETEIGRWFVQDLLQEKFYSWSSYSYCMNNPLKYVDPNGEYPIITITKEKTGSTADQRVLGYTGGRNIITQVDLYKATVIDTEDKNFKMTFSVTRDAWTIEAGNGNTASNVGFEPQDGNVNHYTGKVMKNGYPEGNGTTALKVTQYGSEVVHAESNETSVNMGYREKSDIAAGVMIHVGGNYDKNGSNTIAASEGCFGIVNSNNSSSNQSNQQSNNVLNTIINQADKSRENQGHIRIIIEKRNENEYPNTKTVP
jgi:RHS repeat-associated protein